MFRHVHTAWTKMYYVNIYVHRLGFSFQYDSEPSNNMISYVSPITISYPMNLFIFGERRYMGLFK